MLAFDSRWAAYDATSVANQFIIEYMPSAKGEHVKVYLYGLMLCAQRREDASVEVIAHDLEMNEEDVQAAFRHWEYAGLVERVRDEGGEYRYIHPIWRSFMAGERGEDPAFQAFMEGLYAAFGGQRDLHGAEKRKALEWVEELRLPPEVVLVLVKHLISTQGMNFRFGGKNPERLAQLLADEKAVTVDDALEILARDQDIEDGVREVLRRFRLRRQPSQDEVDLYRKWRRDWGFSREAILAACAETVKGSPNLAYLDGVLSGIRARAGAADTDAVRRDQEESEQIHAFLRTLGAPGVTLNEGTRAAYRELRRLYPHEVLLAAARECATQGKGLDDAELLLRSWKARGLETAGDVEAYLRPYHARRALLQKLGEAWGKRAPQGRAHHDMAQKWLETYGFPEELILHCAAWSADAERNMPYLDKLLTALHELGVRDVAGAEAQRARYRAAQGAPASRPERRVSAQQYEQRDYSQKAPAPMPDWLIEGMKEMEHIDV